MAITAFSCNKKRFIRVVDYLSCTSVQLLIIVSAFMHQYYFSRVSHDASRTVICSG